MFGTILGIVNSFPGIGGEESQMLGRIAKNLSESLVPAALGLRIALFAFYCYKYLLAELNAFDLEMENASLQLISNLRSTNF